MRKSKIIGYGRLSLESDITRKILKPAGDDPSSAKRRAAHNEAQERLKTVPQEDLLRAGKVFLGRKAIRYRTLNPTIAHSGFSASRDTVAKADAAARWATEDEALTAFNKKQAADRIAKAMGATLVAGVAGCLWYAYTHDAPADNRQPQPSEIITTPFPNHVEIPTDIYRTPESDREIALAPITTSTPVPPATPLYS